MAGIKNHKYTEMREVNGVKERKCTHCDQWLTLDKYYSNCKDNAYWIDSNCKKCRIEKQTARQKERRQEINQNKRDKKIEERGVQSPFNYIANKYLLMPQMMPLFPTEINTFVDLFCGSATVGINSNAKKVICNDIDTNVINFYNVCKDNEPSYVISKIKDTISEYNLGGEDQFKAFRDYFNEGNHEWNIFYSLVCHSFNQHPLYNKKFKYNAGWGKDLCHFNFLLEKRVEEFSNKIQSMDIEFTNYRFQDMDLSFLKKGDFLYADPPYLLSTSTYIWNEDNEKELLALLDKLDKKGVKFAVSNVFKHKKCLNDILIQWSKKYKVHRLQRNYSRLTRGKQDDTYSTEVLVVNY